MALFNTTLTRDELEELAWRQLSDDEAAASRVKLYVPFDDRTGSSVSDQSSSPSIQPGIT